MSSLKHRIELLEKDLKADPPRISVYHDLPFAIFRYDPEDEWKIHGRSVDRAVLLTTRKAGIFRDEMDKVAPRLNEIPFDSRRRFSASLSLD